MDVEMRILMVGLDAAGKTTILYKLKKGEIVKTIPTIGFNVEEIEYKNIGFSFWDVGGLKSVRALWQHYVDNIHGLIFVVDSSDRERIDEAKYELTKIWNSYKSQGHKLLIIANKQDLPNSMNSDEITDKLDLPSLQDCDWYIQETNTLSDDNIYKGLDWLSSQLKRKQTAELFDKPT